MVLATNNINNQSFLHCHSLVILEIKARGHKFEVDILFMRKAI